MEPYAVTMLLKLLLIILAVRAIQSSDSDCIGIGCDSIISGDENISRGLLESPLQGANNHTFREELNVLREGQLEYKSRQTTAGRHPLLCATFMRMREEPLKLLKANIAYMKASCDWAVVVYDGDDDFVSKACSELKANNAKIQFRVQHVVQKEKDGEVIHCMRSPDSIDRKVVAIPREGGGITYQNITVPKTVLYNDLLPLLPKYKRVFLLDEDISLDGFNASRLFEIWDCAFWPHPKPLVVQPLIVERTQYFPFVYEKFWRMRGREKVLASGVGLVEQQVPLFDAAFFEWFVKHVISRIRETAKLYGVDQTPDRTWCKAAKLYGIKVLEWYGVSSGATPSRQLRGQNVDILNLLDQNKHQKVTPAQYAQSVVSSEAKTIITPCALITGTSGVHHLNTRSLANKRANRTHYRRNAQKVVHKYQELFPTWVIPEIRTTTNPLDRRHGRKYKKFYKLDPTCVSLREMIGKVT